LQQRLLNPVSGWFGQNRPFDFGLAYRPAEGLRRFLSGTPPVLSLAAVEPAVDVLLEAGIDRVRAKSVQQSEYLIGLWEDQLQSLGFQLNSPRESAWRGSHVSLGHPEGLRIDLALIRDMHVLPDYREPGNIRLGIAPLYTRYWDIWEGMRRLRAVVVDRLYERYPAQRPAVT
jgi:kynureninase